MGDIYRKPSVVTVCLTHSARAATLLDQLTKSLDAVDALNLLEELSLTDLICFDGDLAVYRTIASRRRLQRWFALMKLLANPRFECIWVVHEVALASSVRVVYEAIEIPWSSFVDGIGTFSQHPLLLPLLESTKDFRTRQATPFGVLNVLQSDRHHPFPGGPGIAGQEGV